MKYRVIHRTEYEYSDSATFCHNIAHLTPRPDFGQVCSSHFISVVPHPTVFEELKDHFGNRLQYFSIEKPHKNMVVTATSMIESKPQINKKQSSARWDCFLNDLSKLPAVDQPIIREFMLVSPMIPHLTDLYEYARPSFAQHTTISAAAADLMERIFNDFTYDPAFTTLATPLSDVIQHRRGVCQDFAHLAIGCLRSFGLSARYTSGYMETKPPQGGKRLIGADASHAWLSVFTPDEGWINLDPTNNQHPDHRYITLSWGRDYTDVPPLKGVIFGGGTHKMTVSVDVEPLN